MKKAAVFVKKNIILCVAFLAASATLFFVPPDGEYVKYFDFKTLSSLFCVLAVVCALKNINFFYTLARKTVQLTGNTRSAILALVYITFLGSMLIANDMALLTFLPLGYFVLSSTKNEGLMAFCFIMQNIAANLGGMLTPFGNPQNLFLYTRFNIPTAEFMGIMLLPFLVSVALITFCCFVFVKPRALVLSGDAPEKLPFWRTAVYIVLFALSIAIVFRAVPYVVGLAVIFAALVFLDRRALLNVDYGLLLTFACFFVFAGNLQRIDAVNNFLSALLQKNTLLVSALSCQFISNVPSAVLLSGFTADYPALLRGVNIGGTGTLIASLASLITFREYCRHNPGKAGSYILKFSAFNFAFLLILLLICSI